MVGKICTVCKRCSYVEKHLSFFTYPSDTLRRQKWLIAVNRLDLMNKLSNPKTRGNYRICEVHFEKSYIQICNINKGRKYLSKDALPSLNIFAPNNIVPMSSRNFLRPPDSLYAQNSIWRQMVTPHQRSLYKQAEPPTKYNIRPIEQENKQFKNDQREEIKKRQNKFINKIHLKRTSLPHFEDASQYCQSIIRVSQSTQTATEPVIDFETKRRMNNNPLVVKKINTEETTSDTTFLKMCSKYLSPSLTKLVKWNSSTKNGNQHVNFLLFALNLYYSSNLYNLLRNMLSLPSRDALKYLLYPKSTRLSEHFLNAFRCKISNMSNKERMCSFSVSCFMLKPNLYYNIMHDRIIGLHDVNGVQNISLAKYAVVLMVQGILASWRQPIAYAFISEYDNNHDVSTWIDEVLTLLIDIGLDIRVFISDPRSEFFYESESRFVIPEKTYFTINRTNIFYTYDLTQLLKIVRNNLRYCNFYYSSNSKNSVNKEIYEKINNLCNVLKSKIPISNSQYKNAFSNIPQKYFLNHMVELFHNLKVLRKSDGVDVTDNMKFIQSFQISINSVLQLFEELNFLGVKHIFTNRINYNCLNRAFANMRQHSKVKCTPREFNKCFVRSLVFNMLKKPISTSRLENCDAQELSSQLLGEDIPEREEICNQPILVHTIDYRDNLPEKNAFVYICGYCYMKCIQVHNCDMFKFYLDNVDRRREENGNTYLCSVNLDLKIGNCKMLPPEEFTEFLMLLEIKFKEFFKRNLEIRSLGQELLKELEPYSFSVPCPCFPIEYLKALFVRVRLFYTVRENNNLLKRKKGVSTLRVFSL